MKPATARVLKLLEARGRDGVTGLDAINECGVYRLSGRIHELRHPEEKDEEPIEVITDWRVVNGARFAVYRLPESALSEPVVLRPDRGEQVGAFE